LDAFDVSADVWNVCCNPEPSFFQFVGCWTIWSTAILQRDPHELEFIQAVQQVVHSLEPVLSKMPQYDPLCCALHPRESLLHDLIHFQNTTFRVQ
jgi:hypothetical protein